MAKSQWQPIEGVVVNVESAFGHHEQRYTIQVRRWDGPLIQRAVKYKTFPPYDVGTRVKVQISADNEIRFDPGHPGEMAIISTMDMSDQIAEASAVFGRAPIGPTFDRPAKPSFGTMEKVRGGEDVSFVVTSESGTPVELAVGSGIAAAVRAIAVTPGASVHMVGPSGLQVSVDPAEIKELAHTMRSSDADERKAAIDRWHQLKAQALGQAPPESSARSSSGGEGGGTIAERLKRLDTLLSAGILTQSEYDAQRQRILSEL